jgi:DNA-binding MarR family transcriptional regulator
MCEISEDAADVVSRERAATATRCVCFNLRKASRATTQIFDEALRPTGLRGTQFSLVAALRLAGPLAMRRLAEVTVTDRTTLTRNLRPLEREGLVRIERGTDRRERVVTLTRPGHAAFARAFPIWEQTQRRVAGEIGAARLERLLDDLLATVEATRIR